MTVESDKFAAPGALRMALAFAVFVHHTTLFNLGMSAVLIFFVLSGYWVAVMWRKTYSKTAWSYFTFLVSRMWRVVPVFALCSAITWALLVLRDAAPENAGGALHQILSNVMILGYNSLSYQANVPGWSLDMEMQFYLIAPLLIFLVAKNVYVLLGCVALSLLSQKLGGPTSVLTFLYFFGIGVASALHDLRPSRRLAYGALFAALAVMAVCAAILTKNLMLGGGTAGAPLLAFSGKTNLLIAVLMTPFALYTTRQTSGAADRMFGELSYIFYLLHWPVIGALGTGEGGYLQRLFLCTEAVALILALSFLIWRLFDRPIGKRRSAWVSGRLISLEPALQPLAA